jgi:pyruvate kinase
MQRRTRIVATVGPATDRPEVMQALLRLGVDVFRVNFSHGTRDEHLARIAFIRKHMTDDTRPAILGDLPGPKLRVLLDAPITLANGQEVDLARKQHTRAALGVTIPEALENVEAGQRVLLDDGRLQMRVLRVEPERVVLKVEDGGPLLTNKGINLPDTDLTMPAVTERDVAALEVAAAAKVDWLALSFVRSASAAAELRAASHALGLRVPILAKMEKPEAVREAAAIVDAFDGIMVARGDLGVEIALEKVPHVQKRLIALARAAGKPVITATDMLDSMRQNPRPTRAEASDVANAVYDGTDAVMLSGETSIGEYPVDAVECMDRIVREAESEIAHTGYLFTSPLGGEGQGVRGNLSGDDQITAATCALATDLRADAIIAPTVSGRTARMMARHRPLMKIVAPTADSAVVRQLALVWGVVAVPMRAPLRPGDDRLEAAVRAAFEHRAIKPGDLAVLIGGHPIEGGPTIPTIRVVRIGASGEQCEPLFRH